MYNTRFSTVWKIFIAVYDSFGPLKIISLIEIWILTNNRNPFFVCFYFLLAALFRPAVPRHHLLATPENYGRSPVEIFSVRRRVQNSQARFSDASRGPRPRVHSDAGFKGQINQSTKQIGTDRRTSGNYCFCYPSKIFFTTFKLDNWSRTAANDCNRDFTNI